MRRLFWGSLVAYLVVVGWVTQGLPATVPIHFDASGSPDNFASRAGAGLTFVLVGVGLAGLLGGLAELSGKLPMSLVNVPDKDWWSLPENRPALVRMIRTDLYVIGVAMLVLLVGMVLLTASAAHSETQRLSGWSWVLLAAFVALVVGYAVRMRHRYRRPA